MNIIHNLFFKKKLYNKLYKNINISKVFNAYFSKNSQIHFQKINEDIKIFSNYIYKKTHIDPQDIQYILHTLQKINLLREKNERIIKRLLEYISFNDYSLHSDLNYIIKMSQNNLDILNNIYNISKYMKLNINNNIKKNDDLLLIYLDLKKNIYIYKGILVFVDKNWLYSEYIKEKPLEQLLNLIDNDFIPNIINKDDMYKKNIEQIKQDIYNYNNLFNKTFDIWEEYTDYHIE